MKPSKLAKTGPDQTGIDETRQNLTKLDKNIPKC